MDEITSFVIRFIYTGISSVMRYKLATCFITFKCLSPVLFLVALVCDDTIYLIVMSKMK